MNANLSGDQFKSLRPSAAKPSFSGLEMADENTAESRYVKSRALKKNVRVRSVVKAKP